MKVIPLLLVLLLSAGTSVVQGKPSHPIRSTPGNNHSSHTNTEGTFNLVDFGAVGDGTTDDGPALQLALNALADAGGGTLFVPAGRYVISTPVLKDFTGLADDIVIAGVESLTPAPPPTAPGNELSAGLDLVSEFAPRTGSQDLAINLGGLKSLLIKDVTFIGTPEVLTDASITLLLSDIQQATIHHCEFYGLSSIEDGGAIVWAVRSNLKIEQTAFLGSATSTAFMVRWSKTLIGRAWLSPIACLWTSVSDRSCMANSGLPHRFPG